MTGESLAVVITAILGGIALIVTNSTPAYLAWRKSRENAVAINELTIRVDGRLDALLRALEEARVIDVKAAKAEGKLEGRAEIAAEHGIVMAKEEAQVIAITASRAEGKLEGRAEATAEQRGLIGTIQSGELTSAPFVAIISPISGTDADQPGEQAKQEPD